MTIIRIDCGFCREVVDLRPDQIIIANYPERRLIEFECPNCETPMDRECGNHARGLLLSAGVVETNGRMLPQSIVTMLRELRNSDERMVSSFGCQLDSVRTIDDIEWT